METKLLGIREKQGIRNLLENESKLTQARGNLDIYTGVEAEWFL